MIDVTLQSLASTYKLNDGHEIPVVGFGTWQMDNDENTTNIVKQAIKEGYTHIDTAAVYGNEEAVGKGIRESGVNRSELFVTTKLWNDAHGYEEAKVAIDESLERLGLDYVDLYLIHWPNPKEHRDNWQEANLGAWRAMEEAVETGKVRSIGVSNFHERHLTPLLEEAKIKPVINQIFLNPSDQQPEIVAFNEQHDILSEAYSPLGTGKVFEIEDLADLAKKYAKTIAQVVLRWSLQKGYLPLPKTSTPERVPENADLFDFEISEEDMERISALKGQAGTAKNPDEVDF